MCLWTSRPADKHHHHCKSFGWIIYDHTVTFDYNLFSLGCHQSICIVTGRTNEILLAILDVVMWLEALLTKEHLNKICLTHFGPVTAYSDVNLDQCWLRWWIGGWRQQTITWTNVDLPSMRPSAIHSRVMFTWTFTFNVSIASRVWYLRNDNYDHISQGTMS